MTTEIRHQIHLGANNTCDAACLNQTITDGLYMLKNTGSCNGTECVSWNRSVTSLLLSVFRPFPPNTWAS